MSDDLFELLGVKPPTSGNAMDDGDDLFEIAGIKMDPRKQPGRTWGEAAQDTAVQLAEGVNTIAGAVPNLVAPQSGVAGFFRDNADHWRGKQSEPMQRKIAQADAQIATADQDSIVDQAVAAAKAYSADPALAARFVVTNLPSMIPGISAAKLAQAAKLAAGGSAAAAAAAGTTAAGVTNAVLNGGGARGEAFEDIRDTLIGQGLAPEEAERAALDKSLLPAAVGGATGFLSGKTGLERALVGKGLAQGGLKAGVRSGAVELAGEQAEELLPQVATNYQAGEIDQRPLSRNIGRTAVETAIASGPTSAVSGVMAGLSREAAPSSEAGAGAPPTQDVPPPGVPPAPGEAAPNPAPPIDQPAPPATGTVAMDQGQDALLERALDAAGIEREALQPGQPAAEEEAATARLAELEVMASSQGLDPAQQAEREALAVRMEELSAREAELEATGEAVGAVDATAPTNGLEQNAAPAIEQQAQAAIETVAPAFDPGAVQAKTWPQFVAERGQRVSELRKGTPAWDALQNEWAAVKTQRAGINPEGTGAIGAPTPEIQNRDRSRPASVVQMQAMAQSPDYQRLGISRSPESGAPMVFAVGDQVHAARAMGAADVAVMSDGQRVPFQYAVMEAADVQPSNFADGGVNPLFDAAHPGTVKALNNGRTAGVRAAYERGTAETYKQELMADSRMHGIDPAAIEGMRAPMLVRLYAEGDNRTNMGAKSQSQALGLSATEQAATDAALMDAGVLDVFGAGGLDSAGNRDFARAFMGKLQAQGQDVAGMMDAHGALSPAGVTRLQAALVHKAYGDGDLVESMFGSTDTDIRAIGEALKDVAGEWANMRHAVQAGAINPQVDVTGNLLQAIRMVQKARRERASLHDAVNQVDMVTGDVADSLTVGMLRLLYSGQYLTRAVGRERLTESLREYMGAALATSVAGDMFGEQVGPGAILSAIFTASSGQPTQQTNHANTQPTRQPDPSTAQGERVAAGSDPAGGRADAAGQQEQGSQPGGAGQATDQAGRRSQGQDAQDPEQQQDGAGDQGAGEDGSGAVEAEPSSAKASPPSKRKARQILSGEALETRNTAIPADATAIEQFNSNGKEAEFQRLLAMRGADKSSMTDSETDRFNDLRSERSRAISAVKNSVIPPAAQAQSAVEAAPKAQAAQAQRDSSGRAERRAPLTGKDRWPDITNNGMYEDNEAEGMQRVADYMNGDLTRTDLFSYLESTDLEPAVMQMLTTRMQGDALTQGETDAMMKRRHGVPPALDLTAPTKAELLAKQEAQEAADKQKAKDDAKATATDKAARDKKEVDARMDASAENFTLGQDAEDSLSGQGDLLGTQSQRQSAAPSTHGYTASADAFTVSIPLFGDFPYRASQPYRPESGEVVSSRVITTNTKASKRDTDALGISPRKAIYAWRVSVVRNDGGQFSSAIEVMEKDHGRTPAGEVIAYFTPVADQEAVARIAPAIAKSALKDWQAQSSATKDDAKSAAPSETEEQKPMFSSARAEDQTQTEAFKKWFGGSKVVGADGKPLVMYHGTTHNGITEFRGGTAGAMFFASDPAFANDYTLRGMGMTPEEREAAMDDEGFTPVVMPVYVKAENPFDFERESHRAAVVNEVFKTAQTFQSGDGPALVLDGEPSMYTKEVLAYGLNPEHNNWDLVERDEIQNAIRSLGFDSFFVHENGAKNVGVYSPTQVKSATGNNGAFDGANPDIRFSFAGARAETADAHAMLTAQGRIAAGEDAELVRKETGWHTGADGKWRFEIADNEAKLLLSAEKVAEAGDFLGGVTVGDVLDHPKLFAAYPALAQIPVDMKNGKGASLASASINGVDQGKTILMGRGIAQEDFLSVLLHELQHGIQDIEGFASGGSPQGDVAAHQRRVNDELLALLAQSPALDAAYERWAKFQMDMDLGRPFDAVQAQAAEDALQALRSGEKAIDLHSSLDGLADPDSAGAVMRDRYNRLAGEVEARNTQARQKISDIGRKHIPPSQTADVPASDVIVVFNGKEMQSAPAPANAPTADSNERLVATQLLVDGLKENWIRSPDIEVVRNMQDARIPKRVRDYDAKLKSQGSDGEARGFIYGGKVYLLSDELKGPEQIATVLFHEVLGHYGLRGAFGDALAPILQQIGTARRKDVLAKAREYGMASKKLGDAEAWAAMSAQERQSAAEEVLAEMAETQPSHGFVKRAISAIRNWLRANVPGFKDLALTDEDIVQAYLIPARGFVTRSKETGEQSIERAMMAFSRAPTDQTQTEAFKKWFGDSKVVDAEGNPLVVYHGTTEDFSSFDPAKRGSVTGVSDAKQGFFFAAAGKAASEFTWKSGDMTGSVMPVYLSMQNPLSVRLPGEWQPGKYDDALARAKQQGNDGLIVEGATTLGTPGDYYIAFQPEQIKSAIGNNGDFDGDNPDIRFSRGGPPQPPAGPAPGLLGGLQQKVRTLTSRENIDSLIYQWQDKFIDLKRIQQTIQDLNGTVSDTNNAYRGEELYHKRVAKRASNFLRDEVRPLLKRLNDAKVHIKDFEEFLHARHAPEANAAMAARNLSAAQLDAQRTAADRQVKDLRLQLQRAQAQGMATTALQKSLGQALVEQDDWKSAQAFKGTEEERLSLSGMSDQEAAAIMTALSPEQRITLDDLAARVDAINAGTLKTLEDYGLMDRPTLNAWRNAYQHYVPLHRDEAHPDSTAHPIGQGFSVKGSASRQRTGSNEKVTNIFGHVMMQREAALTRGEKSNVTKKLYLLAAQNPDPEIWSLDLPKKKVLDPDTGLVRTMVDQGAKLRDNVVMVRIGGKDKFIVFNEHNERAVRLAMAMRNLDAHELDRFTRTMGRLTRWFSAVNTQYNPIFGVVNLARDTQATMLQLTNTPLAGKQGQVLKGIRANMASIYKDLRRERREAGSGQGPWGKLWEQMQLDGGTTGFRDLYANPEDRAEALQKALDQQGQSKTRALGREVMGWLSDFNETMEATTRLAVYKVALDSGIGRDHAASIAKNITVNFNRKGRNTSVAGSYYAFLNAAIQGNVRMLETLTGPQGRKIMAGGVMLGMLSSMAGALMMGGDGADDEWKKIPEFVKERSIIIPLGPKDYVAIPMPLGFHVFPNIGRKLVEIGMHDDPTTSRMNHVLDMAMIALNAYNPLGGSENIVQMLAPTPFDPVVSLMENKDWTGKSIYKEQRSALDPKPGHAMAKDSATPVSRWVARAINGATGGNEWKPGALSPNPDAIEYLFGQITGGVGREATKLGNMATSAYTGEELAPHQIVLAGRFYGNTRGVNGQSSGYYENLKRINTSMSEAKGRSERGEGADAILADVPLARLDGPASVLEKRVGDLAKMRRKIQASEEPNKRELVKEVNAEMERSMRLLNQAVEDVLKERGKE